MKKEENNHSKITIYLQLATTLFTILFAILYLVNRKFIILLEFSLGIDFIFMAINNRVFYKRKGLTLFYIVFAFITIIIGIVGVFNG